MPAFAFHQDPLGRLFRLPALVPTNLVRLAEGAGTALSLIRFAHRVMRGILSEGKYIHLDGLDGLGFTMHHAAHFFGRLTTKDGFPTVHAHRRRNVFHSNGFPVDVEDLADELFLSFGFAADVTPKHAI